MLKAASTGDLTAGEAPDLSHRHGTRPAVFVRGNDVDYALQIRAGEALSGEDLADLFAFAAGGERNVLFLHSEQVFEKGRFLPWCRYSFQPPSRIDLR